MIKKLLLFVLAVIIVLLVIIIFNALRFKSAQPAFTAKQPVTVPDSAISHYQQGIRFKTVSYGNVPTDSVVFNQFHLFLQKTYPLIYSKLQKTEVAKYTLVFKWPGKDTTGSPVVLMAHQDVVPVEKEALSQWKVDPFGGVIKDGMIWGRGSADDKISLFGILEATEKLLSEGYTPARTVYLVFGHDEEAGGSGASASAKMFAAKGIKPAWVLDEGGEITKKAIPGFEGKPVALIGTSEKGYISLDLSVDIEGGHSSMPGSETAIDIIAKAVENLRSKPFDPAFSKSTAGTFNYLGPEMPFGLKAVVANQWLFRGLLYSSYQKSPGGNALIRTTIAPTIIQGGMKDNVVPTYAHAVINFRVLPGNTLEDVVKHVTESVNDKRVKITRLNEMFSEPSHVTDDQSEGFQYLAKTIRGNYPGSIVAPYLCVGATDSRKFEQVSPCVLRFSPVTDIVGLHGLNERVTIEDFKTGVNFYYQLLKF